MEKTLRVESYSQRFDKYDLLNNIEGQKILEKVREQKLMFECVCLGESNPLRMWVRRIPRGRNYHYVVYRADGTKDKHDKTCMNYSTAEDSKPIDDEETILDETKDKAIELLDDEKSINNKVTSEIVNGVLQPLYFNSDNHLEKRLILPKSTDNEIDNQTKTSYRYSTMYSIGENILFHAWHNYVKANGENPNIEKLFKSIYEQTNSHRIGKEGSVSINSVMFKPYGRARYENVNDTIKKAFVKIYHQNNEDYNMYILGKVIETKELYNDPSFTLLTIEEPQKKNFFNLIIETRRFKNHYHKRPTHADKLISCFVRNSKSDYLEVESFAFIPVAPNIGVSVDSNYEVEFAKHLIDTKVLFVKPPKSSNPYSRIFGKSNNPDFLLLDKEKRVETTIVEIFGYDDNKINDAEFIKEYWEKANKKIEYYQSLTEYKFFYWLAFKNPLPRVYQPKKRIVTLLNKMMI